MPWLRSMEILNDIHTVFTEDDFNLKSYKARSENNLDKWQFSVNVNGTVTAAAQCYAQESCALYLTFLGNGQVELWDGHNNDHFLIDRDKYTSEEISEQFHEWIAKTYKDAFEDGGSQVLPFTYSGKLSTNIIIPQVYRVFHEMELLFYAPDLIIREDVPPKYKRYIPPKFECFVDGKLMLRKWIDIREGRTFCGELPWVGSKINIIFDGSDTVAISEEHCDDEQRVPIQQANEYIDMTYGLLGRLYKYINAERNP